MISRFGLLGAASGGLAFGSLYIPTVEMPGGEVLGICIGLRVMGACGGPNLAFYAFPGLVFGVVFAIALRRLAAIDRGQAAVFVAGATLAYALAVAVTLTAIDVVGSGPLALAVIGAGAGALGGGLLAALAVWRLGAQSWGPPTMIGAVLGALLPLSQWMPGMIAFYVLCQAGYGAALAAELPRRAPA